MMRLSDWKGGCINNHPFSALKIVNIKTDYPKLRAKELGLKKKVAKLLPDKQYVIVYECSVCGDRVTQLEELERNP